MSDYKQQLIDAIAEEELPALWRFALQITRDKHDAEDLVQRTCVRAMEQSDHYRDTGKLKSWLFRIAHNIWKNELRSRAIRENGNLLGASLDGSVDIELGHDNVTPESSLEFDEVINAVEALPEGQRLVIQLICASGFSYAETASILDVPVGTVMSRLARARVAIGEQFLDDQSAGKVQELAQSRHSMLTRSERQL